MTIAMATVSKSGVQARELGFAVECGQDRLQRQRTALRRAARGARSTPRRAITRVCRRVAIKVAGRTGIANCEMMLVNMKEGGMISAHDYAVAKAAATALCGGDVETGSLVDEQWLLSVERQLFVALLKNPRRRSSASSTCWPPAKPLRN
jgi:3-hydroxyacyl-CoA dehydrogenase